YLEGATQEEAARRAGWSLSTLKRRLRDGTGLLQSRLSRRGLALTAVLPVTVLSRAEASPALTAATVEAGRLLTLGLPAEGARAAGLADAVLRGMFLARIKLGAVLLAAVALAAGLGVGAFRTRGTGQRQPLASGTVPGPPVPGAVATAPADLEAKLPAGAV